MAENILGTSREFIIHPGETLEEILENKGITQKELANVTGFSPSFINNVISGKKNISAKFAAKLEYALRIPCSYWIKLQAYYDAEIAKFEELNNITEEEIIVFRKLSQIFEYYRRKVDIFSNSADERIQISEFREFLQVGNLNCLNSFAYGKFRMSETSHIDDYVLGTWVRISENLTRSTPINTDFKKDNIDLIVTKLKEIMCSPIESMVDNIKDLFADNGVAFEVVENFTGAPVQGYLSLREDGKYQMTLTIRNKYADIFWFTLFHELGHLYNNDLGKNKSFIDIENFGDDCEEKANIFASNKLLNKIGYQSLINGKIDIHKIEEFAKENGVESYVVIGRLQKDGIIPYNRYSRYKPRFKLV